MTLARFPKLLEAMVDINANERDMDQYVAMFHYKEKALTKTNLVTRQKTYEVPCGSTTWRCSSSR